MQRQHAEVTPTMNAFPPSEAAFLPPGFNDDDASHHDWDGGHLWFDSVEGNASHAVRHLVGNVAEFVYNDPDALAALENPTPEVVRTFVNDNIQRLAVIGGSALSPQELPIDQPQPVDAFGAMEGYADVGFRLAFTAPERVTGPLAERLREMLAEQAYLEP